MKCSCVHIEILQVIRRFPIMNLSYDREDFLHVINTLDFLVLNLLEFWDFLNILGIQLLQVLLCLWQISADDSEISDPCLLLQVSLCSCPLEHPFAILENSALRRDWNFDWCLHQNFPENPTCRLAALSIPGLLDAIGLFTVKNL